MQDDTWRSLEETVLIVRRLVLVWAAGDLDTSLDATVVQFSGKYPVDGLHQSLLPHLFLVALESESAEPIGRALDVNSTLGDCIEWLRTKPPSEVSDDYLEWSYRQKETNDD